MNKKMNSKSFVIYSLCFILMVSVMNIRLTKVSAAVSITIDPNTVLRASSSSIKVGWNLPPDNFNFWDDANWKVLDPIKNYMDDMMGQYYRYPGGSPANYFNWKGSIGLYKDRKLMHNGNGTYYTPKLGVDEALKFVESVGGKMIYVLNMSDSTNPTLSAQDSADLVEYLNGDVANNPNGGTNWAQRRSDNGHPAPYNIKLFELGNELDWPEFSFSTGDYNTMSHAVMNAMLAVDPTILFVGHARTAPWGGTSVWTNDWSNWHNPIMDSLKVNSSVIGMAFHPYYYQASVDNMSNKWISELQTAMSTRLPNGNIYVTENAVWANAVTDATSNMDGAVTTARFLLQNAMNPQVAMNIWHTFGKYRGNGRWPSFETNNSSRPIMEVYKVLYNNGLNRDIVQSTGSTSTIQVLGAKDAGSGGYYRVSITNYEPTDQTLNITLNGLSSGVKAITKKGVKPNGTDYENEINYTQSVNITVNANGNFSTVIPAKSLMILIIPKA